MNENPNVLREYWKRVHRFDLLDIDDPETIESLRSRSTLPQSSPARWDLSYPETIESAQPLYAKGIAPAWDVERDLDWSEEVSPAHEIMAPEGSALALAVRIRGGSEAEQRAAAFDELRFMLSQLLHGEQAALILSAQLSTACPDLADKCFAATQAADEARHVDAISKFLQRKMGGIDAVAPTSKGVLDTLLSAETVEKKLLGMQVLFEGVALGLFARLRTATRSHLLNQALRRIEQDEARHAAFGVTTLRTILSGGTDATRIELEGYARDVLVALNGNQNVDMLRALAPRYELDWRRLLRLWLRLPGFGERNSAPYTHTVMPNLDRLGLISEATRHEYVSRGLLVGGAPTRAS